MTAPCRSPRHQRRRSRVASRGLTAPPPLFAPPRARERVELVLDWPHPAAVDDGAAVQGSGPARERLQYMNPAPTGDAPRAMTAAVRARSAGVGPSSSVSRSGGAGAPMLRSWVVPKPAPTPSWAAVGVGSSSDGAAGGGRLVACALVVFAGSGGRCVGGTGWPDLPASALREGSVVAGVAVDSGLDIGRSPVALSSAAAPASTASACWRTVRLSSLCGAIAVRSGRRCDRGGLGWRASVVARRRPPGGRPPIRYPGWLAGRGEIPNGGHSGR